MPFGLSFTNPWALLFLPARAAYFVWLGEHSLADLSVLRRRIAIGLRLLVVTCIVLALAGLQVVRFNRDQATIFLLDYSDSISPAAATSALRWSIV